MKTRHKAVRVVKAAKHGGHRHNKPMEQGGEPTPCAILRKLGEVGIGVQHAAAIMKASGYKVAHGTVVKQIGDGRHGRGEVADLSKAEVAKLIVSAPDPTIERWAKIAEMAHSA